MSPTAMPATAPIVVFLDHHASGPSGISTYGAHLAAHLPELYRINLHAACGAGADADAGVGAGGGADASGDGRTMRVPAERSHDAEYVAEAFVSIVRAHPDRRIAWLPNVGDVAWAAAWRALSRLTIAERARVRLFGIVHGDQESQYAAMARYAPIIAGLAGVSQRCVDRLRQQMPPGGVRAEALHYPVAVPSACAADLAQAPLRLLYAGRFEESQKRIARLPELFRQLAQAGVPFTASLAGDGPARASLAQQIDALPAEVRARITLLGPVPQPRMADLLIRHDVLLLVSAFEGTPLVLLEAMAAGVCPVLMDLPGGLPELLADEVNACVVEQGDIAGMVAAIQRLDRDRAQLARMKAAARRSIEQRADPAAHARALQPRLDALWAMPVPDPSLVDDPDPLGRRVQRLVDTIRVERPARIGVWGGGVVGRQIVDRLVDAGLPPVSIVDADPARHGIYRGIIIASPAVLAAARPDLVCVGSVAFAAEIVDALRDWPMPPRVLAP